MTSTKDWQRLADRVARRRADLGLTQIEAARRGPLSLDRLQAIEGAKRTSYRLGTLLALARALEWESDSIEAILDGDEPTPLEARPLEDAGRASDDVAVTRGDDAELDELIEQAKIQRDRGNPALYDTLMAVKRMNEVARQVRAEDAQVDKGSQRAG